MKMDNSWLTRWYYCFEVKNRLGWENTNVDFFFFKVGRGREKGVKNNHPKMGYK